MIILMTEEKGNGPMNDNLELVVLIYKSSQMTHMERNLMADQLHHTQRISSDQLNPFNNALTNKPVLREKKKLLIKHYG